jgi:catechol 2,3-dioxygenase-like lactoylglutathione lyase family enzyme
LFLEKQVYNMEAYMKKLKITGFGTHIKVADMAKSREFYVSLGFIPVFAYGSEEFRASLPEGLASAPEKYQGMTFNIGESGVLEIAEDHIAIKDKNVSKEVITSPKVSAMVKVESVTPLFTNPLVNIKFPVRHYYWGTIEVALRDPDGYVLLFIAPYSEEEYERVSKYTKVETILPG